ncbi:DUF6735 family protein [Halosegnis marinus]|uniref:DUF6735 family protein n=1 Tax=Halosegnis marinus TaxID=3034023 RepID=A0ABD5ZN83_9EURY|nr:DUF6735 family protein [Halosegnis sp. DT85]
MADRTLVAYRREAGYDLHYAHDGVAPDALSPSVPFGGASDRDLSRVRDRLAPLGIDLAPERGGTAVDPVPLATGLAWDEVVAGLDYRAYDRCLRVAADWTVERFLVCYFGLGDRGGAERDPAGDGALVPLTGDEEPYAVGWFEGVKSAVADAARCGLVDEAGARSYMAGRARAFAGDREAHVGL